MTQIAMRTWEALIGNFLGTSKYFFGNFCQKMTCLPLTGMFWISYWTEFVQEDWAKSLAHLLNRSSWRSGRHRRFPPSWSPRRRVHSFTSSSTSSCSVHPSTSLGPRRWSSGEEFLRLVAPSTQSFWVIESLLPSMYLYRVACGCQLDYWKEMWSRQNFLGVSAI